MTAGLFTLTLTVDQWHAVFDALSMHVENEECSGDYEDPDAESDTLGLIRPIVATLARRIADAAETATSEPEPVNIVACDAQGFIHDVHVCAERTCIHDEGNDNVWLRAPHHDRPIPPYKYAWVLLPEVWAHYDPDPDDGNTTPPKALYTERPWNEQQGDD